MEEQKRHPILKILLLDIGVVGTSIFGALGIIIIIFIALNYFNVLSLSDLYPKYLSLLPRQQSTQTTTKPILIQPNITTNSPFIDKNKAKTIVSSLIKSSIQIKYQPELVTLKPGVSDSTSLLDGSFHASWDIDNGTGAAILILSQDKKNLDTIRLGFVVPVIASTLTPVSVKSYSTQYFSINTAESWGCTSSINGLKGTYCESFWTTKDKIKTSVYVRNPSMDNSKTATIILCQIYPSSFLYSWNSCNPEFAKEGIQ